MRGARQEDIMVRYFFRFAYVRQQLERMIIYLHGERCHNLNSGRRRFGCASSDDNMDTSQCISRGALQICVKLQPADSMQ